MLNINKQLYKEILTYCEVNNIDDVDSFCNKIIEIGFNIEKYGDTPQFLNTAKKNIEPVVSNQQIELSLQTQKEPEIKPQQKIYKKAKLNDDYRVYDDI